MRVRGLTLLPLLLLGYSGSATADDVVDGRFGPGALYRLVRPTVWNGSLVLYAHGFVLSDAPVALPPEGELLTDLLAPQGFAVAFTSFSENGWAVKDGAQRTHQLLGIFTSTFGLPSRVYIGGASMGGLIAIKLVEQHPGAFAGALPSCAVAGGAQGEFHYLGHLRALFDFFYPGVLPGSAANVPPGLDITRAIVLPAVAAMQTDPAGAFAIGMIEQTPVPFASANELMQSIATALAWHAMAFEDLLHRIHGHSAFDNHDTQYSGTLPLELLAAINASVARFDGSADALAYLDHYYEPSGELQIPMLLLSTSRDPVVPGFHQAAYRDAVAAAGNAELLVERTIDRYGHCSFTPEELASAFEALALWVEPGIKPAS
jgi:pimeloyl-ACP methyl ester carboxylesterase